MRKVRSRHEEGKVMAKIHDLFIVELAEVIKGYGNDPDYKDPFRLSEFYRFYELPNIAISRENFEKMRPIEPERKTGKWVRDPKSSRWRCSECCSFALRTDYREECLSDYCSCCGAYMRGKHNEQT